MTHPDQRQLVFYYYGESPAGETVRDHLSTCGACRREYRRIQQTLNAVDTLPVPERDHTYGREVWDRIEPRLERRRRSGVGWWPGRWRTAAALTTLVVVAFLAGRFFGPVPQPASPAGTASLPPVRERVLLAAVGDHLERSGMVLAELVNARQEGEEFEATRERAESLVGGNRLLRQAASGAGEDGLLGVLEDLERVLVALSNSTPEDGAGEIEDLRRRVEAQGLLFKVKVLESRVREARPALPGTSL